ncbi:hypothetical protein B0H13DRAFT_1932890 [Mycena leptocephala]|nr:hypothetical protein B0H13DRAFT_1932890 [Mycena leptocephala]
MRASQGVERGVCSAGPQAPPQHRRDSIKNHDENPASKSKASKDRSRGNRKGRVPAAFLVQDADCGGGGNEGSGSGIGGREGIVGEEVEREDGREEKRKVLTGQLSGLGRFYSGVLGPCCRIYDARAPAVTGFHAGDSRQRTPGTQNEKDDRAKIIRMVARHDRGSRKEYLQSDDGLHAEPDGVDEVDDVRGEGAKGTELGGEYGAIGINKMYEPRAKKEGTQHPLDLQPQDTPAMAHQTCQTAMHADLGPEEHGVHAQGGEALEEEHRKCKMNTQIISLGYKFILLVTADPKLDVHPPPRIPNPTQPKANPTPAPKPKPNQELNPRSSTTQPMLGMGGLGIPLSDHSNNPHHCRRVEDLSLTQISKTNATRRAAAREHLGPAGAAFNLRFRSSVAGPQAM